MHERLVTSKVSCIRRKRVQIKDWQDINKSMVIFVSKGEKRYDKLFNVKYLPLFHHFKAIYQFPKHVFFKRSCMCSVDLNVNKMSDAKEMQGRPAEDPFH
jgi:hypothetical protein